MVDVPEDLQAVLTLEVAREIARAYDDRVVFPHRELVDPSEAADRMFPDAPGPVLVIAVENQAVCAWGVPLGTEHPVVLVGGELLGLGHTTVEYAPSVQAYVDARHWDLRCLEQAPLIQAQAGALTDEAVSHLATHFEESPSTRGWPGTRQLRYQRDSVRILLWLSDDQCDWWISADSPTDLECAVYDSMGLPDLADALWSNDAEGQRLLARVRSRLR